MRVSTGNLAIDALVYNSWNSAVQTPVTLTYSFLTRTPISASTTDRAGFQAMSVTQEVAVRDALAKWATVANITFVETAPSQGNLQFGTNAQTNSAAYAYLPGTGISAVQMYLNNKAAYNAVFTAGSYAPSVLIHEIGHMLGLKHPGDYDALSSVGYGPFLPDWADNGDFTVMSYNDPNSTAINYRYQSTAMLYDIQAIQYLYGANMGYHAGDDVYVLTSNIAPMCIWDAGGSDVLDFSACSGATVINLNAGEFSESAAGLRNISIAYNVTIESAIGGAGGATFFANAAGNRLIGGAGNDLFYQGAGNDTIAGAGGTDTVVFGQNFAGYAFVLEGNTLTVRGDGTDTLTGIELLRFADRVVSFNSFKAGTAFSSAGNDVISATAAGALIDGGTGLDTVVFNGGRAGYTVKGGPGGFTVAAPADGTIQVVANVERLQFADSAVALDTSGSAGQLYRLYEGAFNRAPDHAGFGYWLNSMDRGMNVATVAAGFGQSAEFAAQYASLDNAAFVEHMYVNALDRASEQGGFDYWMALLNAGATRGDVLAGFAMSVECQARLVGSMVDGVDYIPYA